MQIQLKLYKKMFFFVYGCDVPIIFFDKDYTQHPDMTP